MVDQSIKDAVRALNGLDDVVGQQAAQLLIGYVLLPVTVQYLPFQWKKEYRFALHLYGPTGTYEYLRDEAMVISWRMWYQWADLIAAE